MELNGSTVEKAYIYANGQIIAQHDGAPATTNKYFYLPARQYDPYLARFTARDPVQGKSQEPPTLHRYSYCINDPINRHDPNRELFGWIDLLVTQCINMGMRGWHRFEGCWRAGCC
jgi:RHS repeat-associated protein